jgi:nucleotide-binding universal stress UspA family protein
MYTLEIKKILIPTDFSETANLALEHAVKMASLVDAQITLVHVVSTFAFRVNLPELEVDEAAGKKLSTVVGAKLASIAEEIGASHGVKVTTMVTSGRIREEVVRIADEIDADIIILGTHGVSGLREFFMGSNAFRIVSEAACPVLSVQQSGKSVGFSSIVVPIDNSFHSREKLGIAVRMANAYDAEVHVCGLRSYDHDDEDYLKEREVRFTTTTLFCSNIAASTMEFASEKNADLIVIMNEQEINTTGFFMGPYAQQVVNHSHIPVLSVRPTTGALSNVNPY